MSSANRVGLAWMVEDLCKMHLVVALIPCSEEVNVGAMKRVTISQNPKWYRELCARHSPSRRKRKRNRSKPDTYIKRANIKRVLDRLACDKTSTSKYADELLGIAEELVSELMYDRR